MKDGNAPTGRPAPGSFEITTPRFLLRPMRETDLIHVLGWWNDPEVRAAHALGVSPLALEHVETWFHAQGSRPWAWVVEGRGAAWPTAPIGMVELAERPPASDHRPSERDTERVSELGITLDAGARGRGFGREIVRALADWALACGVADRVELTVLRANGRARRAFEHAGFRMLRAGHGEEAAGALRMVYDPGDRGLGGDGERASNRVGLSPRPENEPESV